MLIAYSSYAVNVVIITEARDGKLCLMFLICIDQSRGNELSEEAKKKELISLLDIVTNGLLRIKY
jgi:hypothetical protein